MIIRLKRYFRTAIIFVTSLLFVTLSTPDAQAKSGKDSVEKLVSIFKSWKTGAAPKQIYTDAANYIDYSSMSEASLGAEQWAKLKPAERADFTAALRKLVEERYYPRWHKLFSRGTITYGEETVNRGDIILKTILQVNKKTQDVLWQLDGKGAPPKVKSLKVDEKDLLMNLHDRISPRLKKSGFKQLLSWLQNRASIEADAN